MMRPSWIEMLVSSRMRVMAPLAAIAGVAGAGVAGRQIASAQSTPSTDDPQELLDGAIAKMAVLESYSFELEVTNGEIQIVPEVFTIHEAEGDVLRPDSFQTESEIELLFVDIDLKIVTIGDDTWITNPLTLVGSDNDMVRLGDTDIDGNFNPAWAVNPDYIALPLLGIIENPEINEVGSNSLAIQIDGTITRDGINGLSGAFEQATISDLISDSLDDLRARVWIDKENRVTRFNIIGQIFDNEDSDISRNFTFDDFDEPVTIDRP